MKPFVHTSPPARIVFGRGSIGQAADEVRRLGAGRALVLSTAGHRGPAEELAAGLGAQCGGIFAGAVEHTPVVVTVRALETFADVGAGCVVSLGGGSTTGLGKAIAARTGAAQMVIPTTYAGSEVTGILGETENGVKTTRTGPEILPEVVIYDADLTDTLPVSLSVTSGLNAMAHAAEGVYARDGSPVYTLLALEGLRALKTALPAIKDNVGDRDGRDMALYGAWLCGTVLGGVGMSIHHKLCHLLGGTLNLPHAATHAVLLPHTIAFVEEAVPQALVQVAELFGGAAGAGLHDFESSIGAPLRLADLGVERQQLDAVAELAAAQPYWTPRPVERDAVRDLLEHAWAGERPAAT